MAGLKVYLTLNFIYELIEWLFFFFADKMNFFNEIEDLVFILLYAIVSCVGVLDFILCSSLNLQF